MNRKIRLRPIQTAWVDIEGGEERREFLSRRIDPSRSTKEDVFCCGAPMVEVVVAIRKKGETREITMKPKEIVCVACQTRLPSKSPENVDRESLMSKLIKFFSVNEKNDATDSGIQV